MLTHKFQRLIAYLRVSMINLKFVHLRRTLHVHLSNPQQNDVAKRYYVKAKPLEEPVGIIIPC